MKTTVEISDALFREAKRYAAAHELTFREVLETGLRAVVEKKPAPPVGRKRVMTAALRAHFEVGREGVGRERVAAPDAFAKHALSEGSLVGRVAFGRLFLGPVHAS